MTLEDVNKLVELFRQSPILGTLALLPWLSILWRQIRSKAPAPTPGTTWATICAVVDLIAGVIPTAKVDAKPTAASGKINTTVGMIREYPSGVPLQADMVGFRPFKERRQKRLRAAVRQIAAEKGLNPTDAQIDATLADVQEDMKELSAGPLMALLQWIIANPQVILAILSLFMGEKANDAAETTV